MHEGEIVLPAMGDEAASAVMSQDAAGAIEFHFPVEIEVRVSLRAGEVEDIVNAAFEAFAARLEGR